MRNAVRILRVLLIAVIGATAVAEPVRASERGVCTGRMTKPSDGGACACSTWFCEVYDKTSCNAIDAAFYEGVTSCSGVPYETGTEDGCCTFQQYMNDNHGAARNHVGYVIPVTTELFRTIRGIMDLFIPCAAAVLIARNCHPG